MNAPLPQAAQASTLHQNLLRWYDNGHRDLPWRHTDDPYAIWISEVMCQQTRVDTVIPYYHAWLEAFPDVPALAAATEDQVFERWQGLGYYTRARNLRRGAQHIRDRFDGTLPSDVKALLSIPGIGRYTAGAIASIAFGSRAPVVDGNVTRVFARVFAIEDDVRASATQRRVWAIANALVHPERPGDFNQALMELGATVCTPKSPKCSLCPIEAECSGRARADQLPYKSKARKARKEHRLAFALRRPDGKLLVARNPAGSLLGGMWQYPMCPAGDLRDALAALAPKLAESIANTSPRAHPEVTHVFTHIHMRVTPVAVELPELPSKVTPPLTDYAESAWMSEAHFAVHAQSTLVRKLADAFVRVGGPSDK